MSSATVAPWGLSRAKSLEDWDDRIKVLEEIPFYRGMKKGYPLTARLGTCFSDVFKVASMIHLQIN